MFELFSCYAFSSAKNVFPRLCIALCATQKVFGFVRVLYLYLPQLCVS